MKKCLACTLMTFHLLVHCLSTGPDLVNEFVIDIAFEDDARSVIESMGFEFIRKIHGFDHSFLAKLPDKSFKNVTKHLSRIKRSTALVQIEQQKRLIRKKRDTLTWNDAKYPDMWYLNRASNTEENDDADLNVQEAWQLGYSGRGVVVTIMDDGLDYTHPDISANYAELASWDVNNGDRDPMPNTTNPDNKHGTRCAGQVAAVGNNSICIVGVAFRAKIGGIRMLDGTVTDRVEAESLNFNQKYIDIYSGSWGPDDTGRIYEGPGRMASEAFHKGATTGRNGLGNVFVWASGNGGRKGDSCAADGYVSSIYTLAVSSVTEHNSLPWYLEKCSAILVSTYSSGGPGESGIVTTDLNHGCTNSHTGTSASAPLAVGIIALMLEANPKLTWRDVQYLTVLTANTRPFKDGNFSRNGAGYLYSSYYGFGLMDAGKAVRLSEIWRTLPPHHRCTTNVKQLSRNLSAVFSETYAFNFTGCRPSLVGDGVHERIKEEGEPVAYVEHVQVFMTVRYAHRGLVRVTLTSPSGTASELMPVRIADFKSKFDGLDRWPLMSVQFWGEPSAGEWKITIDNEEGLQQYNDWKKDQNVFDKSTGVWESVHIVAYGTETFPIRLRAPREDRLPPKPWFDRFERYIQSDAAISPSGYTCHVECATNECWGPSASQCLKGCKNYVTESGQCVAQCPMGTSAVVSTIVHVMKSRDRGGASEDAAGDLRCERCFSACAECLRPYSEHGCTACSGDSFLAPYLSPLRPRGLFNAHMERMLTSAATVRGGRLLVGQCVSRCPTGYYANATSKICEQCTMNCDECSGPGANDCLKCAKNYRLIGGKCLDTAGEHQCPTGSFLTGNLCVPCAPGCKDGSCSKYGLCTYCDASHPFMHEGRCETACPVGYFAAFKLHEDGLYESETGSLNGTGGGVWVCSPCPPGCATCSNSNRRLQAYGVPQCDSCAEGLALEENTGSCKSTCPSGTFGPNCSRTCHHMCMTCVNELDSCLQCSPGAYLAYGERQLNPKIDLGNPKLIGYGCVKFCPEATYPARIDGERVCLPCPPPCKACSGPNKCMLCEEGFTLDEKSGLCKPTLQCPQAHYFNNTDQKCKPCHSSCARCRGPGANECVACYRSAEPGHSPAPACLEPPIPVRAPWLGLGSLQPLLETPMGMCFPCCHVAHILDTHPPAYCLFCLPNDELCSSWASVGGGLGLYENYTLQDSQGGDSLGSIAEGWALLTSDPIRLSFFVLAIFTIALSLIYLVFVLMRRYMRKKNILTYQSLLLHSGRTGSRLSERTPNAGHSPVIALLVRKCTPAPNPATHRIIRCKYSSLPTSATHTCSEVEYFSDAEASAVRIAPVTRLPL